MDRDRGCSELYREVGAGERREGAAGCGTDVVWGDGKAGTIETLEMIFYAKKAFLSKTDRI